MKWLLTAMAGCLLGSAAFCQEPAEACRVCHKDELSLQGWETAELAVLIRQMREGSAEHVVPIPDLTDEELEALAAALTDRG